MLQALQKTIIVRKYYNNDRINSKIFIPENSHFFKNYEASEICEVLSVSNQSEHRDYLQVGDFIICNKGEGIKIENSDFIMKDKWVYAIIDKEYINQISVTHKE